MDGKGGCCIESYNIGSHKATAYDIPKIDTIMLRFRPIAPKPVAGSVASTSSGDCHVSKVGGGGGRGRRRKEKDYKNTSSCSTASKRCNSNQGKKRKSSSIYDHDHDHDQKGAVTLPLLPEAPDLIPRKQKVTEGHCNKVTLGHDQNQMANIMPPQQHEQHIAVGSCIIVEGITDTWQAMGDIRSLDTDTCPGFVTDVWNKITWANEAYRRMVMGDRWRDLKLVGWVVMRECVPDGLQTFTCRVRVQGSCCGKDSRGISAVTLPCDVWRVEGGGFAWRLDVEAALCLGR